MKKLGYFLFFLLTLPVWALVPVEGLLMGEADPSLQTDPLISIFTSQYDASKPVENNRLKGYQRLYTDGVRLSESCLELKESTYAQPLYEAQARRSMVATLQYIGLDSAIKAIGAYAKRLEIGPEKFKTLSANLVTNYCSKNVTVISLRNIERSLQHYYDNPAPDILPSLETSPYGSEAIRKSSENVASRSREFDMAIKSFRSLCSWGGNVDDYRMLAPYLKNPFVMGMVIQKMSTKNDVKVACHDLVCRAANDREFSALFPLSIGSTGVDTDLKKQYCSHFRFQEYEPKRTQKQVAAWMKKAEIESPILETNFFISLISGVPDLLFGVEKYNEAPALVRSTIEDRWKEWANRAITPFARDLYFEESLRVSAIPRRDLIDLKLHGFAINFDVTVGEIDRLLRDQDKITMRFDLKLSKNYLRSIRTQWNEMGRRLATDEHEAFFAHHSNQIAHHLAPKEKLFQQKMWNDDFARLVSREIIQQVLRYEGRLFDSYQDEMLTVPVTFAYGVFALNYMHYRSDLQKGRLKVNL